MFDVRITCRCGLVREIDAHKLVPIVGWQITLTQLAQRMRCTRCGHKGAAEVVAVSQPRPRGIPKNPH